MKLLLVGLLLALATLGSASLLEMSQVLWSRVLGGGYKRIGKLDPLRVPVIKVDQSEGNASYRVILRNLEVTGLNGSRVESVHIVRGKLKSNLSDGEAGYVSYNEQRAMDSIRYRFHTLVKEPKPRSEDRAQSASSQFERIVEFDPAMMRAREDEDFLRTGGRETQSQRFEASAEAQRENGKDNGLPRLYNRTYQSSYGDMRVAMNSTPRSPSSVRVVYTHNYKTDVKSNAQPQDENERPCIGACRRYQDTSSSRVETRRLPAQQQGPFPPLENGQNRNYQAQQYNAERVSSTPSSDYALNGQFGGSNFQAGSANGQRQFSVKSAGNQGISYSNYRSGQAEGQYPEDQQRQAQFAVKGGGFSGSYRNGQVEGQVGQDRGSDGQGEFGVKGAGFSGSYRNGQVEGQIGQDGQGQGEFGVKGGSYSGNYRNGQLSVQSNGGENYGPNGQRQSQFALNSGSFNRGREGEVESSASGNYEARLQYGGASFSGNSGVKGENVPPVAYSGNFRNGQLVVEGQGGNRDGQSEQQRLQARYQAAQRSRFAEQTTPSYVEEFAPYKAPAVRMENQPGYVDIVYASEKKQGSESRFENLRAAPESDPRAYGLEDAVKDLSNNQRYIIHNFTEGESLSRRNDAARVAAESKRLRDLIRYAKEYQEKQGYFEEGMELIYHFGNVNGTGVSKNETLLQRRKRQHVDDKDEDDVMHVILRIRVPQLSVRSGYALNGKVGSQPVRGSGLLTGNFTDLIADFTVELKQVDNKTMIVRAARAKLVSKDHRVRLQDMDDKGPVESILIQGVMAAEAVAAMIADDLATKALSEDNADGVVYKMYKNLPVIEKA